MPAHPPADAARPTPATNAPRELVRLFLLAMALLIVELLTARHLQFVAASLDATMAIALATTGIGLGSAAETRWPDRAWRVGEVAFAGSVAAVIGLFLLTGSELPTYAPLLTLPFLAGGAALSRGFAVLPPRRALAADLAGAAAGSGVVAALLPSLHEEGLQLLAVGLAAVPLALRVPSTWILSIGAALLAVGNSRLHLYDHVRDLPSAGSARKVFGREAAPGVRSLVASSVVGRVDITIESPFARLWENGNLIDQATAAPATLHAWDPRVPKGVLAERPRIFIVGPAFQGVLKPAVALGGKVRGVEINAAALRLYQSVHQTWCGGCYDGVDAAAGDGRRWLERHPETYDYITLLNTFSAVGDAGRRGPDPDFLHTREAVSVYFDRLSPTGIITWEIPLANDVNGQVITRIVETVVRTMVDRGVADPTQHLVLYEWAGAYTQLLVRGSPWTPEALDATRAWLGEVARGTSGLFVHVRSRLLWTPDGGRSSHPAALAIERIRLDPTTIPPRSAVLSDDRPFPFWNATTSRYTRRAWAEVALFGGLLLAIPGTMALREGRRLTLAVGVAALSGIGFLAWEVWWIHALRRLTDAPLVIGVLAPLLGAAMGALLTPGRAWTGGLILSLGIVSTNVGGWLAIAAHTPDPWRGVLAVLLSGGPAIFMGGVLPQAIKAARDACGDRGAVLAYGINGGAAAIGSAIATIAAPTLGLQATLGAIVALYVVVLLGLRRLHA